MILTNRLFERGQPDREAKSIYIFCEGAKREYAYFRYFREIDSRINIEVYKLNPHEDNSPLGLLKIARNCIIVSETNPHPQYEFQTGDEVWIILNTDVDKYESRKTQIEQIKQECNAQSGWFIAQSNPCFEVWLYYHLHQDTPQLEKKKDNANLGRGWLTILWMGDSTPEDIRYFFKKLPQMQKIISLCTRTKTRGQELPRFSN